MAGTSNDKLATYKKLIISSIAIFITVIFIGCYIEKTKPVASRVFVVQYPVGDASAATMYGYGPADGITLLMYLATALILTSGIEDIVQILKLSKDEAFSQQMTQILFYIFSLLFGAFVLSRGSYDWGTFMNGLPDQNVPFLMKVFFLCQLGFLMQCFPQAILQGLSPSESLTSLIEAEVLVVFLAAAYVVNYTPMAVVALMSHYTASFLLQLTAISSDSRSFKTFMKYALFVAENTLTVGAAACMCKYGDSPGSPLRCLTVAGAVAWAAVSGHALYKGTFSTSSTGGSGLPLLPNASAARKTRRRSKSRRGNGDRKSSRRRRR